MPGREDLRGGEEEKVPVGFLLPGLVCPVPRHTSATVQVCGGEEMGTSLVPFEKLISQGVDLGVENPCRNNDNCYVIAVSSKSAHFGFTMNST